MFITFVWSVKSSAARNIKQMINGVSRKSVELLQDQTQTHNPSVRDHCPQTDKVTSNRRGRYYRCLRWSSRTREGLILQLQTPSPSVVWRQAEVQEEDRERAGSVPEEETSSRWVLIRASAARCVFVFSERRDHSRGGNILRQRERQRKRKQVKMLLNFKYVPQNPLYIVETGVK